MYLNAPAQAPAPAPAPAPADHDPPQGNCVCLAIYTPYPREDSNRANAILVRNMDLVFSVDGFVFILISSVWFLVLSSIKDGKALFKLIFGCFFILPKI